MNSKKYFQNLLYSFLLFFGFVFICGAIITFTSVKYVPSQATTVSATVKGTQITFQTTTGTPGIILTLFGFIGLLTLLIKIPVKEAVLEIKGGDGTGRTIGFLVTQTKHIDHKLPVLFYWFFRNKMNLFRETTPSSTILDSTK